MANLQTQTTKWVHKYRWHAPGLWQEYTTPSGYRSISASPPTLSSEMRIRMEQRWRGEGGEAFFFFLRVRFMIWITRWGQISLSHPQWYGIFFIESLLHYSCWIHYLISALLASCSSSLVWHTIASAHAWRAVIMKICSIMFSILPGHKSP